MRVVAILILVTLPTTAQLSGSYTIDPALPPGGRNFQSFQSATAALASGITGPVVFNVASTTFNESVSVPVVPGASGAVTVTFVSSGPPAVIAAPASNPRYGIAFAPLVMGVRFTNFKVTGYTDKGIFFDGKQGNQNGPKDCAFTDVEVDDGGTSWPSIYGFYSNAASERNRFLRCIFRASGQPYYHVIANNCVWDSCEFDGKGIAKTVVFFNFGRHENGEAVMQNCLVHGCAPTGDGVDFGTLGSRNVFAHNTVIVNTSGAGVHVGPIYTSWSDATIVKNNVLVNMGTGAAIQYRYEYGNQQLGTGVGDYNAVFAPSSRRAVLVGSLTSPVFGGTVAQFLQWQRANPGRLKPGGPTLEANSIQGNPGLVSLSAPLDIHLTAGSPLIDRAAKSIVPGYVNIPQVVVGTDFEGDPRGGAPDIGADELVPTLTLAGTGQIGTIVRLDLLVPPDAGLLYQLGTALGTGPILIGNRPLGLSPDVMLYLSVSGLAPSVFQRYGGVLDAVGRGIGVLNVPNVPGLKGVTLYTAFVTVDTRSPQPIRTISNTVQIKIQ